MDEEKLIPISALQHFVFCPRQCALIHIERLWTENYWTAQGRVLHQRTDEGTPEQRANLRVERSVPVVSNALGIHGVLDVMEIDTIENTFMPVEYKRGKPKLNNCDKVQLCAQALCLEEMRSVNINRAAIWYWQVRKRSWIDLDENLRNETKNVIRQLKEMFAFQLNPAPIYDKRCLSCSLIDDCQPQALQKDFSERYVRNIYRL